MLLTGLAYRDVYQSSEGAMVNGDSSTIVSPCVGNRFPVSKRLRNVLSERSRLSRANSGLPVTKFNERFSINIWLFNARVAFEIAIFFFRELRCLPHWIEIKQVKEKFPIYWKINQIIMWKCDKYPLRVPNLDEQQLFQICPDHLATHGSVSVSGTGRKVPDRLQNASAGPKHEVLTVLNQSSFITVTTRNKLGI